LSSATASNFTSVKRPITTALGWLRDLPYVSDADALYASWSSSGVKGRLIPPHDTPYGLREFAFVDRDGTAHRVGSPLPEDH
jgi:hypothetical protein